MPRNRCVVGRISGHRFQRAEQHAARRHGPAAIATRIASAIVDAVRVESRLERCPPFRGTTAVHGAVESHAVGEVRLLLAEGAAPAEADFHTVYSGPAPVAGAIGSFVADDTTVAVAGPHVLRVESHVGTTVRREDVRVQFEPDVQPPWPVRLDGGTAANNSVVIDTGDDAERPAVVALRQLHPHEDVYDVQPTLIDAAGATTSIGSRGRYPGPVCAGNLDGGPADELVVLEERDTDTSRDATLHLLAPSGAELWAVGFAREHITDTRNDVIAIKSSLLVDDLDDDGWDDIVLLTTSRLHVLDRNGAEPYGAFALGWNEDRRGGLAGAADFNADGRKELVIFSREWVTSSEARPDVPPGTSFPRWISTIEVYELDPSAGAIVSRASTLLGTFETATGIAVRDAVLGDVDGNGVLDIVSAQDFAPQGPYALYVAAHYVRLYITGELRLLPLDWFAPFSDLAFGLRWDLLGLALADLDRDRRAEVVVSGGGTVWVLDDNGAEFPGWRRPLGPVDGLRVSYGPPAVGDVDGDGVLDVIVERIGELDRYSCEPGVDGCCPALDGGPAPDSWIVAFDLGGDIIAGQEHPAGGVATGTTPSFADFDADGQAELLHNVAVTGPMTVFDTTRGWPLVARSFAAWSLTRRWDADAFPWVGYRGSKGCQGAFKPLASRVVDLGAHEEDAIVYGADPGDGLAMQFTDQRSAPLTTADVGGDATDDLVVGAPGGDGRDETTTDAGEVRVVFGGADLPRSLDLADVPGDVVIYGAADYVFAAQASPRGRQPRRPARPGRGRSLRQQVVDGAPCRSGLRVLRAARTRRHRRCDADAIVLGAHADDRLGIRLVVADFDLDGYADVAADAPQASKPDGSRPCCGELAILRGSRLAAGGTVDLAIEPTAVMTRVYGPTSQGTGMMCGVATALQVATAYDPYAAGDVNGDLRPDLALASDLDPTGDRPHAGIIDVFLAADVGAPFPAVIDRRDDRGQLTILGRAADYGLGHQLAIADIDADAYGDVVAGAPAAPGASGRLAAGQGVVAFGAAGRGPREVDLADALDSEAVFLYGPEIGTQLGMTVATAFLNGDGSADILAGGGIQRIRGTDLVAYPGEVHVVLGSTSMASRDLAVYPPDLLILGADALDPLRASDEDNVVDLPDGRSRTAIWTATFGDCGRVPGGDGPDESRWEAGETAVVFGGEPFTP